LSTSSRTYILQRHLPGVHDGAVDYTVIGGRNLQNHGTGVLGVEERHQIDHVGIRCERLVLPVRQARPVHDLVGLAAELEHLLVHEVVMTAGMPQMTASTARRSMLRRELSAEVSAFAAPAKPIRPNAAKMLFFMAPLSLAGPGRVCR
jgi:hypothetical protein